MGRHTSVGKLRWTALRILGFLDQDQVELSLALVGNREIQELNARYRYKNEPTDVLSFPSGEWLPTGMQILGDVVISVEQAARQARERKKTLGEELETLLVHGILHLLGYDHEGSQNEAKHMWRLEKEIQQVLCEKKN
ncbi:MAG: rRNA maturation RNase YbeY [Candidatus Binatia bacterium]